MKATTFGLVLARSCNISIGVIGDERPGSSRPRRCIVRSNRSVILLLLLLSRRELFGAVHRDLGRSEQLILKISAVWAAVRRQLHERDAVNAPNPTRQMTLVGKASARCDFGEAGPSVADQLDCALQSQMHDVAVRRHSHGSA